jgi:predicted phosphodiesterase
MSDLTKNLSGLKNDSSARDKLGAIADLLDRNNIDLDEVGTVTKVSVYQQASKDAEGDVQVTDLIGVQISPKWAEGPAWPVVQPAQPTVITPLPPRPRQAPSLVGGWEQAVILPDPQIGFREYEDSPLDPFHDPSAIDCALEVLAALEHDAGVQQVINLGDFLDLPAQGKYEQEASFQRTTQPAIDYGHYFLAQQRANAPAAKIVLLEGNHDRRMQRFIQANALSSFGLRRANMPESWPVMSLPYLLRLDELDVEYMDGWPAASWWINEKLRAVHGDKVKSNGSTAAAYTNDMPHISTVFGHIHRQEIQSKTTFDRQGKIKVMAISPGCLCRVDGSVPSVKGAVGIDGRPIQYFENWQQGLSVITYKPSGAFHAELVHIDDGETMFRGQKFGK